MEPIRILQVLGRLDRGGAETMIMNLYRQMDRSKIQFDFVIHTEDVCDYSEEVKRLGGRIYSMKPFTALTAIHYRKQWKNFFALHKGKYGVIHGHMRSTASIYLKEAKRAGLITIVHSHNTSSGKGVSAIVKNVLQFQLRFTADYLFACSKMAGVWLFGEKACQRDNFRILLNGIEPEHFACKEEVRTQKRLELQVLDKKVFFHAGRMENQKNHVFLIQIMKEIVNRDKTAVLWLCGMGELEETLREKVCESGLSSNIRFLGVRTDIPALMQAADVMIFPSLFEGLPVTLIEAQAAGLPVLMADTITDEVIQTDLVKSFSLAKSPAEWAKEALIMEQEHSSKGSTENTECTGSITLAEYCRKRRAYASIMKSSGYSVQEEAVKLSEFYLMLNKRVMEEHRA